MRKLATLLRSRDDDADVNLVDAAYWMKGCSSLGRLRYAVLLEVGGKKGKRADYCLMDLKEAAQAAAPHAPEAEMPADQAERVVEGGRRLSPFLGDRMRAVKLMEKSVFVRELLPQDLKIEMDRVTREEAVSVAIIWPPSLARLIAGRWMARRESDGRARCCAIAPNPSTLRAGSGTASCRCWSITNALTSNIAASTS